jgi:hypothetical protein
MLPGSVSIMRRRVSEVYQQKPTLTDMRRSVPLLLLCILLLSSCNMMRNLFSRKEKPGGCPVGRNIGAEKILAGDEKSIKAAKKAGNYKSDKFR